MENDFCLGSQGGINILQKQRKEANMHPQEVEQDRNKGSGQNGWTKDCQETSARVRDPRAQS